MKTTFFTSFLFVLISIQSLAQIQTSEIPFIEVTGTAEMEVIPDMIYLKIVIGEKNSRTKSKISIQQKL